MHGVKGHTNKNNKKIAAEGEHFLKQLSLSIPWSFSSQPHHLASFTNKNFLRKLQHCSGKERSLEELIHFIVRHS